MKDEFTLSWWCGLDIYVTFHTSHNVIWLEINIH